MAEGSVVWDLISRDRSSSVNDRVGRSFDSLDRKTSMVGRSFAALTGALKYGAVAIGGLGAAAAVMGVKTLAQLETTAVGFETLLGSAKKANDYIAWMKDFAAKTPFELEGLTDSARLLLGVGASAKETKVILQAFGDTAGAVGMDAEHFKMAMLALSQTISSGKLKLGDMNQLMNDGIPIWKLLSEATGKPVPKIQEMISKGELLAKDVLPKLYAQMNKDYGGAMARQSETLNGLWSTFMDTINLGLADALRPFQDQIKGGLKRAIEVVGDTLKKVPGWVKTAQDALKRIDFAGIFAGAKDAYETAKAWFGKVSDGIDAAIQTKDWGPLGEFLGGQLSMLLTKAFGGLGDMAKGVDWVDMGKAVGAQAIPFVIGFVNALFYPLTKGEFWKKHWDDVLLFAVAFIPFGKAGSVATRLFKALGFADNGLVLRFVVGPLEKVMGIAVGLIRKVVGFIFREMGRGFEKASGQLGGRLFAWGRDVIETGYLKGLYAAEAIGRTLRRIAAFIPNTLGRLAGGIWTQLEKIGSYIIGGLIQGIRNKIGELGQAVKDVATSIPDWLMKKLDMHSPSKVTALIGRNVVEGIIVGIKGHTSKAKTAVERLVDVIGSALDRHKSKLADLKSAYADLKGSVRDAFSMNLSDAGTTFSDILANYRDRAASDKRMSSVIAQLRKMGLRSDLLQQLAAQGPDGLAQANAILGAGRSGIRQLNGLQGTILGYGNAAGKVVAEQQYREAIDRETRAVRVLTDIQKDMTAELRRLNKMLADGHKHIDSAALARALYRILNQGHALGAAR